MLLIVLLQLLLRESKSERKKKNNLNCSPAVQHHNADLSPIHQIKKEVSNTHHMIRKLMGGNSHKHLRTISIRSKQFVAGTGHCIRASPHET